MNHEQYIIRTLELAQLGKGGLVTPNPMVGAVLVYEGRIIGEGWHKKYGEAHAEVNCLASVKEDDKHLIPQSTMYVNLEPCAHHGKTPPCAELLVREKVKEVVICNVDPFHAVDGRGIKILNDAGIKTQTGILADSGRWVNRRFFCLQEQKRPYIILKWAQSADGFFAPLNRSRFQITSEDSKQLLHKWRTEEDAIMVGYNTAKNDNPQLTSRGWTGSQPLRIAIDKNLSLDKSLYLFDTAAETWILNAKEEKQEGNISYLQFNFEEDVLSQLMQRLQAAKKQSLIVEGGATLLKAFINAGFWDEARIFTGDKTMGEGIAVPILTNAHNVQTSAIGIDTLDLYINNKSHYPYVKGWPL